MVEEHSIRVTDDEAVAAIHHPVRGDRAHARPRWLVFCHGFLSDKTGSYERRCERAAEEGFDAVRFDFRGSGDSDGAFVDQDLSSRIADLRAVVDRFDSGSYALFGSSFGCKTAFHAAVDDGRLEAIVGRAPVTYNRALEEYRALLDEVDELALDADHAIDRRFFEDLDRYDFDDVAASLDVPVAIFHGTDDSSVPLADSLEAVGRFETDVTLQTYAGEGHRFSAATEERLLDRTFEWLRTV